jgi:predicted transcriptional regulator
MEVSLTPDLLYRLTHIATTQGRPTETLVQEVLTHYIDEEESRFTQAVKRGEAQLERGEYLSHEQVGERIDRLFHS